MALTIDDLLNSLQNPNTTSKLENSKETWERIGNKDSFSELNMSSRSELESFLKDWVNDNPYNNI
jgi:hypothetical protein|tara:strand:- start:273 stop:467 length:195 start_codon:yes stop_codon:yes gene_type:complete